MKQSIQRQIDNIKREYPNAIIFSDTFTGTKDIDKRPEWNKLYKALKPGDTVVFDEVSRMSRNAEDGIKLYEELFDKGVNLIFLKERHIDTSVLRGKMETQIERIHTGNKASDKMMNGIAELFHEYTIDIAKELIEIAFKQAQAEVDFLHKRTSEGIAVARANGKQIGRAEGTKVETKKAKASKERIIELSKDFKGTNTDIEVMKILGIARNTYYKYKAELKNT